MLLTLANIPIYLTSRGQLPLRDWHHGRYSLSAVRGRNRNFRLQDVTGSGMFLKQIPSIAEDSIAAQQNEAMVLSAFDQLDCWHEWRSRTPRLFDRDHSRHVLLMECLAGTSFQETYLASANAQNSIRTKRLSSDVGSLLARFHQCGRQASTQQQHPVMPMTLPPAITLRAAQSDFFSRQPACQQITDWIRSDQVFFQQLKFNQTRWQFQTIVHGDFKWDNLVVSNDETPQVSVVDWELSRIGDPAWDVAGMLQNYVIHGIQWPAAGNPQADAETFWSTYMQHAGISPHDPLADRVRRYCAARMVQTVLERACHDTTVPTTSWQILTASRSMLCEPQASRACAWAGHHG